MKNLISKKMNVAEVKPFLKWPGGKRWLVPVIKKLVQENLTGTFFEPFLGAGAVFLALSPEKAIISDINTDLISCIQTVATYPTAVSRAMKKYTNTSECYYKVRKSKARTKITFAANFIYLNRTSWGGLYRINKNGEFNVPFGNSGRDITSGIDLLACSKILAKARIVCSDFEAIMSNAQRGDVVYIDPPYTLSGKGNGFLRYNDKLFSWADQLRLARACKQAAERGAFVIVSGLWHDDFLKIYRRWWSVKIARKSLVSRMPNKRCDISELLLVNRKPKFNLIVNELKWTKINKGS